jgi:hypothetical protein
LTFVAVLAGWVLLRSPSPEMAARIWAAMAGLHGWGAATLQSRAPLLAAVAVLLIATNVTPSWPWRPAARSRLQSWGLAVLLVLSLLSMGGQRPFLYFQF